MVERHEARTGNKQKGDGKREEAESKRRDGAEERPLRPDDRPPPLIIQIRRDPSHVVPLPPQIPSENHLRLSKNLDHLPQLGILLPAATSRGEGRWRWRCFGMGRQAGPRRLRGRR